MISPTPLHQGKPTLLMLMGYLVARASTVELFSSISLSNTLLVSSLSNKILSIGQAIAELNCVALMYPNFFLFQDILTKEIIGLDDFNSRKINIVQHINEPKQKLLQLWNFRLGHPSYGYMKHLLPLLFSNMGQSELQFETCILAKSHCISFLVNFNKRDSFFFNTHYCLGSIPCHYHMRNSMVCDIYRLLHQNNWVIFFKT
ncbi:hypothetical protein CR513_15766, partial [Mucuna pruriens]